MKSRKVKITALVLAVVMLLGVVGGVMILPAFAMTEQEIQAELDRLEKEQDRLADEIDRLEEDADKQEEYQKTLAQQISSIEKQVDTLESQIAEYNAKITAKEKEIEQKSADIEANYDKMLERLAAMQLAGENSMLTALLTAEDFTDLLTRAEMLQAIAEQDQELINRLGAEKRDIEAAKQEIVDSKAKLEESKKTLDAKKATLQTSYAKSEAHMQAINEEKAAYEKDKEAIDAQEAEMEEELNKFYQENPSEGTLSPGGWLFPLAAKNYYISSPYGPRWSSFHKGVDLSCSGGSAGKPIVASKSGKVIRAVTSYTPGVGYGKNIIIDHGGGYSTLYAHCSEVLVTVGQTVEQGEVIGKVGNTGHSFGAHLHFEVRINGVHQQPMNYISL